MGENELALEPKKYSRGYLFYVVEDSPAQKLNPITKLFVMLVVSIATFITVQYEIILGLLAITIVLVILSKIPISMIKKFVLALSGMATGFFVVNMLFSHIEGSTVYFDAYVFKIPYTELGWRIYITDVTIWWSTLVFLRTMVLVWVSLWFLIVTRDTDIIYALRRLGLPRGAAFTFALALRSVSMFYDDFITVVEAMKSKGFSFSEGGPITRLKKYGKTMFPLILLAMRRIEEFTRAIESRGFSISCKRKLYTRYTFSLIDLAFFLLFSLLLIVLFLNQYCGLTFFTDLFGVVTCLR